MHEDTSDDPALLHYLLTIVEEMGRRGVVAEFDLVRGVYRVGGHEYHDLDEALDHCCDILRNPAVVH
jgi:hypothetical protein